MPPVCLVGRGSDPEPDALGCLGAEVQVLSTEDPIEGWEWVRAELDAGRAAWKANIHLGRRLTRPLLAVQDTSVPRSRADTRRAWTS